MIEPKKGKNWASLINPETRKLLPPINSTEGKGLNAIALIKFFSQDADQTWYASEFDGSDTLYGLIVNQGLEIGYFSLADLEHSGQPVCQSVKPWTTNPRRYAICKTSTGKSWE